MTAERERAFRNLVVTDAHDLQHRRAIPVTHLGQQVPRGARGGLNQLDAPRHPRNLGGGVHVDVEDNEAAGGGGPARPPRIGLGGAVFRRGDQQIHFQPDLPPRARPPPGALVDPEADERANLDEEVNDRVHRRMPIPVRGRRRAAGPGGNGGGQGLNAEIDERIQQGIRDRDNGGFPGLMDAFGGGMGFALGQNIMDIVGRAGDLGLFERIRAMRQGMGGGGGMPMGNEA